MDDGSYIFDPNFDQEKTAKGHFIIAGTHDAITMVESGGNELSNQEMLEALKYGHSLIQELCDAQLDFCAVYEEMYGKIQKIEPSLNLPDTSLQEKVSTFLSSEKLESLYNKGKKEFQNELNALDEQTKQYLLEEGDFAEDDDMSGV